MGERGKHRVFKPKPSTVRTFIEFVLQKIDMFARPITLTYSKQPKFKSNWGGVCTILVGAILLSLGAFECSILFRRSNTIVTSTFNHENIIGSTEEFDFSKEDFFNFAFSLVVNGKDLIADPTYVSVSLQQVIQTRNSAGGEITEMYVPIPFSKCGSAFDNVSKSKAEMLGIKEYYCPSVKTYYVKGSFYSDEFKYIRLSISKCMSGACQSSDILTSTLENARVEMAILNTYVNFKDYSNPVSHYIDDGNYWQLTQDFYQKTDIFVEKNLGSFEDGILGLNDKSISDSFYQILNTKDRPQKNPGSKPLLSVYFRRDSESIEYKRQIYTIIDSLAKIGGFFKIVTSVIEIILLLFIENLFYSHVIAKLYQLEKRHERIYFTDTSDYDAGKNDKIKPKTATHTMTNLNNRASPINRLQDKIVDHEQSQPEHPRKAFLRQEAEVVELFARAEQAKHSAPEEADEAK